MELERAVRLELTHTGFAIRRLGRLATRARTFSIFDCQLPNGVGPFGWPVQQIRNRQLAIGNILERKERFELSRRVWKTRMFPATSLPQKDFRFLIEDF
jgi:hypothetical protein